MFTKWRSAKGSGESYVIVDSGFPQDLHDYLRRQSVVVTPPQEAISRTIRIYCGSDDRVVREEEPLDHAFDAKATLEQLEKLVGEWLKNLR